MITKKYQCLMVVLCILLVSGIYGCTNEIVISTNTPSPIITPEATILPTIQENKTVFPTNTLISESLSITRITTSPIRVYANIIFPLNEEIVALEILEEGLRIFDLDDQQTIGILENPLEDIFKFSYFVKNELLVGLGSELRVLIWDLDSYQLIADIELSEILSPYSYGFGLVSKGFLGTLSPNGQLIAISGCSDGEFGEYSFICNNSTVSVYDINTGERIRIYEDIVDNIHSISFDDSGEWLVVDGDNTLQNNETEYHIIAIDFLLDEVVFDYFQDGLYFYDVRIKNEQSIMIASNLHYLDIWDINSWEHHRYESQNSPGSCRLIFSDISKIIICYSLISFTVWDGDTFEVIDNVRRGNIQAVAVHPNGYQIYVLSPAGIEIWEVRK